MLITLSFQLLYLQFFIIKIWKIKKKNQTQRIVYPKYSRQLLPNKKIKF